MAHIKLDENLSGMYALLTYFPAISEPLMKLMQTQMRSNEGLSMGEREMIATYVSYLNNCSHCYQIHGEIAQCLLDSSNIIDEIKKNYLEADITERQKVILGIAKNVTKGGNFVTKTQIDEAKKLGVSDTEIHDTVLIASMFCFFNRYIDGLGLESKDTPESFKTRAKKIAEFGYK